MLLMKTTKRNIDEIRQFTPKELKGKTRLDFTYYKDVGYYAPSNANWCYIVAIVDYNGYLTSVVLQFGVIV